MNAPLKITLISCAVLGFRHGFDYDHIAAISDITSVQQKVLQSEPHGDPKAIPPSRAAVIIRGFRKLRKKYSSSSFGSDYEFKQRRDS